MQPLPTDFLDAQAKRYDLSPEQTEALLKRLGDKDNEQADAEALHISVNALRNRMTGVYTKFSLDRGGPGKLRRLHDFLLEQYRKAAPPTAEATETQTDIDTLVQTIRAAVHADIQTRCGTMRVLDMTQPIGLGDIYTRVNILENLSGRRRLGLDDLLQDGDLENFDRFLLGQVRHQRVPGLKAVERHNKLMILGKPGAGKTTFMKRLAILCNAGEFQPQRVPVFVTLKDYAEAEGKPKLQTYIQSQWQTCRVKEADALTTILDAGCALVLLDGLDEVRETDHDRVLKDIKAFAEQFRDCQCVITCRIAAREYTFEQFTEVEVADFDQEQIAEFATKWFAAKQDPKKAETFIQRLEANQPIQELATNPLLLTLLCLVFGEAADFPANRAELYKEGLDVLLKKWDGKRNIERDQVYKKLSLTRKEDLLSQLAFTTFEQGNYFFKQATVEQHIIRYIRNLPGASDDDETLQLDGESVLKSIEAQHGLLVERARGIYSFSHLTFQEYFTAKYIVSPLPRLDTSLKSLASNFSEPKYREVFLLALDMLPVSDKLLIYAKESIESLIGENSSLQLLLTWVFRKSKSLKSSQAFFSIRAFYFSLALDLDSDPGFIADYLAIYLDAELELELELDLDLTRAFVSLRFHQNFADFSSALNHSINICHKFNKEHANRQLADLLDNIRLQVSDIRNSRDWGIKDFDDEIDAVSEELRSKISLHRDICHSWQLSLFSGNNSEGIRNYFYANKLLIMCLEAGCYITKATRQYIEDTLLLPLSEIEKYPVP
ncbi:MAG: NACHT domain-containing protein [Nodosilinea sp.]